MKLEQSVPKRRHIKLAQDIFEPNVFPYKYSKILKPSHTSYLPAYEIGTECSETSAYKIQTLRNYPEESIEQYTRPTNNNYTQANLKLATIHARQIRMLHVQMIKCMLRYWNDAGRKKLTYSDKTYSNVTLPPTHPT